MGDASLKAINPSDGFLSVTSEGGKLRPHSSSSKLAECAPRISRRNSPMLIAWRSVDSGEGARVEEVDTQCTGEVWRQSLNDLPRAW